MIVYPWIETDVMLPKQREEVRIYAKKCSGDTEERSHEGIMALAYRVKEVGVNKWFAQIERGGDFVELKGYKVSHWAEKGGVEGDEP